MSTIFALASVVIRELYRRKDFYVLFVLTALITLVMASASFLTDDNAVAGLKEICLLLIWISGLAIAVATAARQIPAERENRTIFPLLAKPVTRGQVVAGKFLGCWLACGAALMVFYVFLAVVAFSREHEWRFLNYLQVWWMQWMFLAVVTAIVLLGSIVFAAPSSNATICVVVIGGILETGRHLNTVAIHQQEPMRTVIYALYFLIPHLEWFDLNELSKFHELAPWGSCALASLYAMAYAGFFLFATWLSFRRKPLNT